MILIHKSNQETGGKLDYDKSCKRRRLFPVKHVLKQTKTAFWMDSIWRWDSDKTIGMHKWLLLRMREDGHYFTYRRPDGMVSPKNISLTRIFHEYKLFACIHKQHFWATSITGHKGHRCADAFVRSFGCKVSGRCHTLGLFLGKECSDRGGVRSAHLIALARRMRCAGHFYIVSSMTCNDCKVKYDGSTLHIRLFFKINLPPTPSYMLVCTHGVYVCVCVCTVVLLLSSPAETQRHKKALAAVADADAGVKGNYTGTIVWRSSLAQRSHKRANKVLGLRWNC